eukprot:CAMPEP_0183706444 /NCGR_PEP_ID=MMETSP0737-20130205/3274_1 /TAXON_ID=385413 /ORGANISM="Thalassiosira miniscula, Strain CCMP1093" /LENGTH=246 /DNA_ID=CAMNT_0025933857 /DNA_START=39 /DNA_END=782 /DNA_ORIENTATION=-
MASETTPLVSKRDFEPPSNSLGSQPTAYFLGGVHRRKSSNAGEDSSFVTAASREGQEVDAMPQGAVTAEFNSRPVLDRKNPPPGARNRKMRMPSVGGGWLDYVSNPKPAASPLGRKDAAINAGGIGTLVLPRKVPLKVEPKVYFANERTLLAWMHVVVMLAGASLTIVTFSRGESMIDQLYGIVMLPVSVAYIFYALLQYQRRALMIKHRQPGPFIDVAGPLTLTVVLMATIITQFCVKLHRLMYD